MSDIDSEVLEKILDPSTNFIERRKAFDEAMAWARGEGWDACADAYRAAGADIEAPEKPIDMILPERIVEDPDPERFWKLEDVPVVDGHATLPDGRYIESDKQVVRIAILHHR